MSGLLIGQTFTFLYGGFLLQKYEFNHPDNSLQYTVAKINIFSKDKIELGLQTQGMFVLRDTDLNPYFLAYQLYHWMAYSKNLSGYDSRTVKQFKNIFNLENDIMARKSLSIDEILSLRESIAREVAAIDMVVALAREISGSKKASDKLKKDGDISI